MESSKIMIDYKPNEARDAMVARVQKIIQDEPLHWQLIEENGQRTAVRQSHVPGSIIMPDDPATATRFFNLNSNDPRKEMLDLIAKFAAKSSVDAILGPGWPNPTGIANPPHFPV